MSAVATTSCEPKFQNSPAGDPQLESLTQKISDLDQKISRQDGELNFLKLQLELLQNKSAVLDTSEKGYACVDSNTGKFLIYCEDVKPYLDGQKATLKVGNPNFVKYSGLKLKVRWGPRLPKYDPKAPTRYLSEHDAWKKAVREKDFGSTADLMPGQWNVVEVTLSPAKPEEVVYLEVSIVTNQLSLHQPPSK